MDTLSSPNHKTHASDGATTSPTDDRPTCRPAPMPTLQENRSVGRLRRWLAAIAKTVVSLAILGGSVGVFLTLGQGQTPDTRPPVDAPKPIVEVATVMANASGIDFDVDGVVVPFQEVEVPAEVAGRVASRSEKCRIGQVVAQGDLLVQIDRQDYELEVRRLEEQRRQADAERKELDVQITAAKGQIELAKEDLVIKTREQQRYEDINDPGVYSQSAIDSVRLQTLQARDALQTELDQAALLESRRARLDSAKELAASQLEKAKLDLARTEIRSPLDGVITQEPITAGSFVQRGGAVAMVQDTACVEIRCSLHMQEMHWLWETSPAGAGTENTASPYAFPETPVTVTYEMDSVRYRWQGTLQSYEGGKLDERTRMIPCRVRVCAPSAVEVESSRKVGAAPPALMPGMFVSIQVHARPNVALLMLPETAVQPGGSVWIVRDGRLHEIPIRVAHADDDEVTVYDDGGGLAPGDLVIVSPLAVPMEDAAVTVRGQS